MVVFLDGVAALGCAAVALFFLRFWRETRDRLFVCLAAAFSTFATNYAILGVLPLADDRRAYAFALRLAGFVAILVGVALKDRELADQFTRRDSSNDG